MTEGTSITKLCCMLFVFFLVVSSFSLVSSAEAVDSIEQSFVFSQPELVWQQDGSSVVSVVLEEYENNGVAGKPLLPEVPVTLLIPHGFDVSDVSVVAGEWNVLVSGVDVIRASSQVALIPDDFVSDSISFDGEMIGVEDTLDESGLFAVVGQYAQRGYELLYLNLYPVVFDESDGSLSWTDSLSVSVSLVDSGESNELFRGLSVDEQLVLGRVSNPSAAVSYASLASPLADGDQYDMLILTRSELMEGFVPLKEAHEARGLSVEIHGLDEIRMLENQVSAEDVRNFIRQQYSECGIQYVLLGGDVDVVPVAMLWVRAQPGEDDIMPSDVFYAGLDGTFNADGDELWGEPRDGGDFSDVDLLAEVYVGRAPVGNLDEVNNFVGKTVAFLQGDGFGDGGKVLSVGELLWTGPDTFGGDYMDELFDFCNASNVETTGIPSDVFDIERLYDRDAEYGQWPMNEIWSLLNGGNVDIVNHLGHSSYGYNMRLTNASVQSLGNEKPFFAYSQGCMAGGFDVNDCIAESFVVKTDSAAFAVIMNARYGWGVVGGTDGANQRFHRQFWDAVFSEGMVSLGMANQDSKEDNLHRIFGNCMRWCHYQLNLFGDPSLVLYDVENQEPMRPHAPEGESLGLRNVSYEFSVSGFDSDGDEVLLKVDWGDGSFSDWLGPFESGEEVVVSHAWQSFGRFNVQVRVRDVYRAESSWSEVSLVKIPWWYQFSAMQSLVLWIEDTIPVLAELLF